MPKFPSLLLLIATLAWLSPIWAVAAPGDRSSGGGDSHRATAASDKKGAARRPPISPGPRAASTGVVRASAAEPLDRDGELRLPPRKNDAAVTAPSREAGASRSTLQSPIALAGGLGIVLGIFLLLAWVCRRGGARPAPLAPSEAVEVLGRVPLAGRQPLHLLRCGNKVLLVHFTPSGAETLTEITEPIEVDRLTGLCYQSRSASATTAFRNVFAQLGGSSPPGQERWSAAPAARANLLISGKGDTQRG